MIFKSSIKTTKIMWSFIILIAIIESIAMSTIEYSANNKNNYFIFGIILYCIIAVILYYVLIYNKLVPIWQKNLPNEYLNIFQ